MGKLQEMIDGYSRLLKLKDTTKDQEELAEARMNICLNCQHRSESLNICKKCGCYLPSKTKCMQCSCPLKYW